MLTDHRYTRHKPMLRAQAAPAMRAAAVAALVGWVATAAAATVGSVELRLPRDARGVVLSAPAYEPPPSGEEPEPPPSAAPESEPPPSAWPPSAPPPSPAVKAPTAQIAPPPRVYFELGLGAAALVNRRVYGFGGDLDLGARFRLPFGAIGASLRLGLEQHIQPEPAPFVMNLGVAITYLLGRPHWRLGPYLGVWAQGMLQRTPDTLGAFALQRNEGGLTLGGLAGAQLRLWRGGLFTELGYRQTVYRHTAVANPAWNTVQLLLGYRFTTQ